MNDIEQVFAVNYAGEQAVLPNDEKLRTSPQQTVTAVSTSNDLEAANPSNFSTSPSLDTAKAQTGWIRVVILMFTLCLCGAAALRNSNKDSDDWTLDRFERLVIAWGAAVLICALPFAFHNKMFEDWAEHHPEDRFRERETPMSYPCAVAGGFMLITYLMFIDRLFSSESSWGDIEMQLPPGSFQSSKEGMLLNCVCTEYWGEICSLWECEEAQEYAVVAPGVSEKDLAGGLAYDKAAGRRRKKLGRVHRD